MEHVVIPTDFFLKEAKQEYFDYQTRLVIELLQNSIDAGATEINLNVSDAGYVCTDNGCGMTKDRMVAALLTMGGTDKLTGNTGGFGAAKKLLLFAHESFYIHSNGTTVEGNGLSYRFVEGGTKNSGTTVSARFSNIEDWTALSEKTLRLLSLSDFNGKCKIYVNGTLFTSYYEAPFVKTIDNLGDVHGTKKRTSSQFIYVRHNGLFMFWRYIKDLNRNVIVEAKGKSVDLFTQNRDGFKGEASRLFDIMVNELTIDKNSFIKIRQRKTVIRGAEAFIKHISFHVPMTQKMRALVDMIKTVGELTPSEFVAKLSRCVYASASPNPNDLSALQDIEKLAEDPALLTDFHIDLADSKWSKVPQWFIPNTGKKKFTQLAALWKVCIREVLKANNINQQFVIGYTFSSEAVATHQLKDKVSCYLLNPKSEGIDKGTKQNKVIHILTTAVHEVVHSQGIQYHDETFMSKFHELLTPTLVKGPSWRQLIKMAKTEKV